MTLGTFRDSGTMTLASTQFFRRLPGTEANGSNGRPDNGRSGGITDHALQCPEITDCSSCNLAWPKCAWCASSGGCMDVTQELKTTAEYKQQNTRSQTAVHVIYNVDEYQRSYGMNSPLDPSETVFGNQCLVWIVNGSSCSHVESYCSGFDGCNDCLRRSGCGWCQNAEHSYNGGDSNICMPGSQSGELTMVQQTSCAQIGGKWVFGSWSKYEEEGQWMYRCPGRAEVEPGGHGSNFLATDNSRDEYKDQGANDQIGITVSIFVGIISMLIILVLIILWITKFRHSGNIVVPSGRANNVGDAPILCAGVDIEALEKDVPSCRPKIIGQPECDDVADETRSEMSVESAMACAVCLANLEAGEEARSLPCGHTFHRECIDSWLSKSHQCPVCRRLVAQVAGAAMASGLDTPAVTPPATDSAESVVTDSAESVVTAPATDSAVPVVTAPVVTAPAGDTTDDWMEFEM